MRPITNESPRSKSLFLAPRVAAAALAAAATLAVFAPASASAQIDPFRHTSSAVGLTDGQTIRLHAHFVQAEGERPELPPGPCRVSLFLLGSRGETLVESRVTLGPARDTFLDYRPENLRAAERQSVRAVIVAEPDADGRSPRIVPSLEVFEAASGRTLVADPGAVRVAGDASESRRDFGTFSLISEQVARLNATCLGVPSDSGLPPGPCNVHLALVSGNGAALVARDLEIPVGATSAIEFPAGVMVEGIRRRLWATVEPREGTSDAVTASVEVFDAPSGKSTLLLPSDFVQSWGWE